MKATSDQAITLAWQVENFGRAGKNLRNLDHYLNPPTAAQKKRGLIEMFQRLKRRQETAHGAG